MNECDEQPDCVQCKGMGGYDASRDCEVYDDWIECPYCEGTGKAKYDEFFVPERDALTPND
jgi:DnaJ-class molecular chaperone